jgi:RimJ/RimL family protein N-acetyltransferase
LTCFPLVTAKSRFDRGKPLDLVAAPIENQESGHHPMRFPREFTLVTSRCRLRHVSEADFPHIWSASHVAGFNDGMRWDPPQHESELLEPYGKTVQWWADDQAYQFTIEERSAGRFLGRIVIRRVSEPEVWNIGFWTHPREQGHGYMTEAARRIVQFGFEDLHAIRIEADHAIWNQASERVLQKLGMTFREPLPQGFQKRGQWVAENRLAITREEWQAARHLSAAGESPSAT